MKVFIDGDSIAYACSYVEHPAQMEQNLISYINRIKNACESDDIVGFVEDPYHKANFRKWVACTLPYKGNRRDKQRPPWLTEAKEFMRHKFGFTFVRTMESEDAVSISAHMFGLDKCIIAYLDKDLEQIPAKFFNYKTGEFKMITQEQANFNLYSQILTGDKSVDNIPGIPGMGPAKAGKQLGFGDGVEKLALDCAKAYKDAGFPYAYLMEQSRLIYILRKRGDVFTPVTREAWELL